jgi:hypothetical protein
VNRADASPGVEVWAVVGEGLAAPSGKTGARCELLEHPANAAHAATTTKASVRIRW